MRSFLGLERLRGWLKGFSGPWDIVSYWCGFDVGDGGLRGLCTVGGLRGVGGFVV